MSEEFRAILYPNSQTVKVIRVPQTTSDSGYTSDEKLLMALDDERNALRKQLDYALEYIQYDAGNVSHITRSTWAKKVLAEINRIGKEGEK